MIDIFKTNLEVVIDGKVFNINYFHCTQILQIYGIDQVPQWVYCDPNHKAFFLLQLMKYLQIPSLVEASKLYDILVQKPQ